MKPRPLLLLALSTTMLAPLSFTQAQVKVGGSIGGVFDTKEDFLVLGVDAQVPFKGRPWAFNPRVTLNSYSGGSATQLDLNVLYLPQVTSAVKMQPYAGAGLVFHHESFDAGTTNESESKVGVNLAWGALFQQGKTIQPFVHAQYTVITEFPNNFTLAAGLLFSIGK